MPTRLICDVEPFRYQATPQIGETNASANQINEQALEDYLNRLREAICADIDSIIADCCNGGGGGGAETFLELTDTPASYAGQANKLVSVNAGANALEFTTPPAASSSGLHKDYSTSEQATDRTWTDGRTIYQKTVDLGAFPNATTKDVAHGITGLLTIVDFECLADNGTNQLPIPFNSTSALSSQILLFFTDTNIRLQAGTDRSGYSGFCTLFYTRS